MGAIGLPVCVASLCILLCVFALTIGSVVFFVLAFRSSPVVLVIVLILTFLLVFLVLFLFLLFMLFLPLFNIDCKISTNLLSAVYATYLANLDRT